MADKEASQKITLAEKNKITKSDAEIPHVYSKYFSSIMSSLNVPRYEDPFVNFENMKDLFDREKYKNHPSILSILGKQFENIFFFRNLSDAEIEN